MMEFINFNIYNEIFLVLSDGVIKIIYEKEVCSSDVQSISKCKYYSLYMAVISGLIRGHGA